MCVCVCVGVGHSVFVLVCGQLPALRAALEESLAVLRPALKEKLAAPEPALKEIRSFLETPCLV